VILSRRRTCPPTQWLCVGRGDHGRFPCSPCHRSVRSASSSTPAASPCLRRSPSTWPPHRCCNPASELTRASAPGSRTAHRPVSTRFEPALRLRGVNHWFACATPSDLASRTHTVWQYQHVPALSGLLPPSPASPGSGCPPLQSGRCDDPTVKVFHLHSTTRRLTAHYS
jgi:hypothetical protein